MHACFFLCFESTSSDERDRGHPRMRSFTHFTCFKIVMNFKNTRGPAQDADDRTKTYWADSESALSAIRGFTSLLTRILFFGPEPIAFRRVYGLRSWGLLADQRGIEPPPAICQRHKSVAIPTEPRGHLSHPNSFAIFTQSYLSYYTALSFLATRYFFRAVVPGWLALCDLGDPGWGDLWFPHSAVLLRLHNGMAMWCLFFRSSSLSFLCPNNIRDDTMLSSLNR